jgi:hypothetical protein
MTVPPRHQYKKSTFSTDSGECVEIRDDIRAVRDSKNVAAPVLGVANLEESLRVIATGQFDVN